jgi:hypothetical protein
MSPTVSRWMLILAYFFWTRTSIFWITDGLICLLDVVADASDKRLPEIARACLLALGAQLRTLKVQILNFDRQIMAWHLIQ